jgi:hypothetical protein
MVLRQQQMTLLRHVLVSPALPRVTTQRCLVSGVDTGLWYPLRAQLAAAPTYIVCCCGRWCRCSMYSGIFIHASKLKLHLTALHV